MVKEKSPPAWATDDPEAVELTYVQVTCLAWAPAHLVNPGNGKVLSALMTIRYSRGCAPSHRQPWSYRALLPFQCHFEIRRAGGRTLGFARQRGPSVSLGSRAALDRSRLRNGYSPSSYGH